MTQNCPLVLVVDDSPGILEFIAAALPRLGFAALTAKSGHHALDALRSHPPGDVRLVLLDVNMPGMNGPETLAALRVVEPAVRCCFMTCQSVSYTCDELLAFGAESVILKPFGLAALAEVVIRAIPHRPVKKPG